MHPTGSSLPASSAVCESSFGAEGIAPGHPSEQLREFIAGLHRRGFSLLPVGAGVDGKRPCCRSWQDRRLPLKEILGALFAKNSGAYGVRLKGMVVLDCDARDESLVARLQERFGEASVIVRTSRGFHLYYAHRTGRLPNLKGEGLPVDVKAGPGHYVIGPHSVRQDGAEYTPVKGELGRTELLPIRLNAPDRIGVGQRHDFLRFEALQLAEAVSSEGELASDLTRLADARCEDPNSITRAEIARLASWAWDCRMTGRIFKGRNSTFMIRRDHFDTIRGLSNWSDAFVLFGVLRAEHGHEPGKSFALSWKGMKRSGVVDLSERRFIAARDRLINAGLMAKRGRYKPGKTHQQFVLTEPLPAESSGKRA